MDQGNKNPPAGANGDGHQESGQIQKSTPNFTPGLPGCQPFSLSADSLTRIAYLAGDLACFYLWQCQHFITLPDPEFNKPFFRACELLTIEDTLLRRAAEAVLAGGEG